MLIIILVLVSIILLGSLNNPKLMNERKPSKDQPSDTYDSLISLMKAQKFEDKE